MMFGMSHSVYVKLWISEDGGPPKIVSCSWYTVVRNFMVNCLFPACTQFSIFSFWMQGNLGSLDPQQFPMPSQVGPCLRLLYPVGSSRYWETSISSWWLQIGAPLWSFFFSSLPSWCWHQEAYHSSHSILSISYILNPHFLAVWDIFCVDFPVPFRTSIFIACLTLCHICYIA